MVGRADFAEGGALEGLLLPLEDQPELPAANETADSFTFELGELEELPSLQNEETVAAPLFDAEPEPALEFEELSLEQLAEPPQWDELELADLELPEWIHEWRMANSLPGARTPAPHSWHA